MRALVDAKVESQFSRAMRYVESVGARAVVPSAGPPCFLDPELFHLNVITGDEPSIFVDQRAFLDRLDDGRAPSVCWRSPAPRSTSRPTRSRSTHPLPDDEVAAIFDAQGRVPAPTTRPTGCGGSATCGRRGTPAGDGRPGRRAARRGGSRCSRCARPFARASGPGCCCAPPIRAGDVEILVDFPAGEVRAVRRRALRVPLRHRPPARREGRRRASRRLEQLAVPVVPLPGVACGRVQRVRLQLLQVTVAGADAAHRGRGAAQARTRRPRPSPTSSSATGWCSAAARTATPTSPCSARSRGAS